MTNYRKLLGLGSYLTLNKHLLKVIGVDASLLFAALLDFEDELINKEFIAEGEDFAMGREEIESKCYLSEHRQKSAEKELLKYDLISIKKKGLPAKNHYMILIDNLDKLFRTSSPKSARTGDTKNYTTSDTKSGSTLYYNKNNNNNNIKQEQFSRLSEWENFNPTVEELNEIFRNRLAYGKYKNQDVEFDFNQMETVLLHCREYWTNPRLNTKSKKSNPKAALGNWIQKISNIYPLKESKLNTAPEPAGRNFKTEDDRRRDLVYKRAAELNWSQEQIQETLKSMGL